MACQCQNGAQCNHTNGVCYCTPGWTGTLCDEGTTIAIKKKKKLTQLLNSLTKNALRVSLVLTVKMSVYARTEL